LVESVVRVANEPAWRQLSIGAEVRRCVHTRIDPTGGRAHDSGVAEYALVTAVMASLAVALTSIPTAQFAAKLPTTTQRATALVNKTAKSANVSQAEARAVMKQAPYPRPPLRYLYVTGWIGGKLRPTECAFAKVSSDSTRARLLDTIRKDTKLLARLARMKVTVAAAAEAITKGTAAAC
jgi:hypothetical protein